MRNLQEQVKKAFRYRKLFWPFTVWINCSNDLKNFANSRPSASNFKSFSRSLEQFFLTVGQNNFGNKIPFLTVGQTNFGWIKKNIYHKTICILSTLDNIIFSALVSGKDDISLWMRPSRFMFLERKEHNN